MPPELSPELRRARRALEGHPECAILEDWRWYSALQRWALHCRLTPLALATGSPLRSSDWFVLADPLYPWGSIESFPAKEGGLWQTYPHQRYNGPGDPTLPWRSGLLCLTTQAHILGRQGGDSEPTAASERLRWYVERALRWLEAADSYTLLSVGDPYELPDWPGAQGTDWRLGFSETSASFAQWQATPARYGLVEVRPLQAGVGNSMVVTAFTNLNSRPMLAPAWGGTMPLGSPQRGAWVRLEEAPMLTPWQAPATWGELRAACQVQHVDLDELLAHVAPALRDGASHLLLLGFPIPETIGAPPCRLHWAAVQLPVLSQGSQTINGFRPQEQGRWLRDKRELLSDAQPLVWRVMENWAPDVLTSRGRLSPFLSEQRILLIGTGALGSHVAELLVRGGVTHLVLVDGETLEAGNLVRHTLTLADVGLAKASALAQRLRLVMPQAAIKPIDGRFPPTDAEPFHWVREATLVIDCTGDDLVLEQLATFSWAHPPCFVSLSFGFQARRLWCFSAIGEHFPHADFRRALEPWLAHDHAEQGTTPFRREGIGCWHPVFPARDDDIILLAALSVKELEQVALAWSGGASGSELVVFEQQYGAGMFQGVRRIRGDEAAR